MTPPAQLPTAELPRLHASIRPIALCVFRHAGRILVADDVDPVSGEPFQRPLGGGIEYGEASAAAVAREIREELDEEVRDLELLGVLENHFTFAGQRGHEVVFVFDGRFCYPSLYERSLIEGREGELPIRALWRDPAAPGPLLYPEGLRELLAE